MLNIICIIYKNNILLSFIFLIRVKSLINNLYIKLVLINTIVKIILILTIS